MKYLPNALFLLLLASVSLPSFAHDGGAGSHGTDVRPDYLDTAWFLGPGKKISVCYESVSAFGVPTAELEKAITGAFQKWGAYLTQKRVREFSPRYSPATQIVLKEKCDGSQDLKFYFGKTNSEIAAAKRMYSHPIGMAVRQSYDQKLGWGQGFVWISLPHRFPSDSAYHSYPEWTTPGTLVGILLHEIGHVLGCDHVPGTIMREDFASLLQQAAYRESERTRSDWYPELTEIDDTRELFNCPSCAFSYELRSPTREIYFALLGRAPMGRYSAMLRSTRGLEQELELLLRDDVGNFSFRVALGGAHWTHFNASTSVFRMEKIDSGNSDTLRFPGGEGQLLSGRIELADGQNLPALVILNNGNFEVPLTLSVFIGSEEIPLLHQFNGAGD